MARTVGGGRLFACEKPFMRENSQCSRGGGTAILTLPNLLSGLRILLIPPIARAGLSGAGPLAALLIALSALTDVLDGLIARRFGQVTQLGKVLDPVADKLTLLTLAVCLSARNADMRPLAGVLIVKESAMLALGALFLRRGGQAESARWYGKAGTALLYGFMTSLVLFPDMPRTAVFGCAAFLCCWLLLCAALYIRSYLPAWRRTGPQRKPE